MLSLNKWLIYVFCTITKHETWFSHLDNGYNNKPSQNKAQHVSSKHIPQAFLLEGGCDTKSQGRSLLWLFFPSPLTSSHPENPWLDLQSRSQICLFPSTAVVTTNSVNSCLDYGRHLLRVFSASLTFSVHTAATVIFKYTNQVTFIFSLKPSSSIYLQLE